MADDLFVGFREDRFPSTTLPGRERGVVGSPHFFTAGGGYFCPGLAIEREGEHLHIEPDVAGFEAFAATALE